MLEDGWKSKDPRVSQLFGDKQYRYKLKLRNRLPGTMYKERNFGLTCELRDGEDKPVFNCSYCII